MTDRELLEKAAKTADAIMGASDFGIATRIALRRGETFSTEDDLGGLCRDALIKVIAASLAEEG